MSIYHAMDRRDLEALVTDERVGAEARAKMAAELERRRSEDRIIPPPWILMDAKQDKVHKDLPGGRGVRTVRNSRATAPAAPAPVAPIVLRLPLPPSTNAAWRAVNGRILLSRAARRWKREAAAAIKDQRAARFIAGRVTVEIDATFRRTRRDLDNVAKLAIDAVKGVCMEDDSQVYTITLRKHVGAEPGLVLAIYANEQERAA